MLLATVTAVTKAFPGNSSGDTMMNGVPVRSPSYYFAFIAVAENNFRFLTDVLWRALFSAMDYFLSSANVMVCVPAQATRVRSNNCDAQKRLLNL
jgi:hypothetical protein